MRLTLLVVFSVAVDAQQAPGGRDAPLVAVSRSGCTARDLAAVYGPDDLVSAWP